MPPTNALIGKDLPEVDESFDAPTAVSVLTVGVGAPVAVGMDVGVGEGAGVAVGTGVAVGAGGGATMRSDSSPSDGNQVLPPVTQY